MRRLVETYRPDVVHLHKLYPQLSAAPVVVAARRGVPLVQTLHDYELISANWTDVRGGWLDRTETRLAYRSLNTGLFPFRRAVHTRSVDAFISVSRLVAQVHEAHGIRSEVIPNFVRAHDSGAPPPSFAGRSGVVYVGRLTEEKGVRDVLELARCLPDVRVSIAGSGPLLGEVRQRAAELDNLSALGFTDREDVTALVAGARLAVVPSLWQEPGALAPLEAMSLGTPVIAYANGGLAEYVADTGGGPRRSPRRGRSRVDVLRPARRRGGLDHALGKSSHRRRRAALAGRVCGATRVGLRLRRAPEGGNERPRSIARRSSVRSRSGLANRRPCSARECTGAAQTM